MNTRLSTIELHASELADPKVAAFHLECLEAEKQLRGASKMAAAEVFRLRERKLAELWTQLSEIDADLSKELQRAVGDWHDVAVKLRGGT